MSDEDRFASVWDALEDDPVRVENLKLRSALMIEVAERIKRQGLTQTQAAEVLQISQPRVSALLKGKINDFRLDSLVDMAHRLGLQVVVWTVNEPARMSALIDLGVDGIISDYPDRLRRVMAEKGLPLPVPTPVEP